MQRRFVGKIVVITGGTSGIGLAAAQRLAGEGASVVIAGRDAERGRVAVAAIAAAGGRALFFQADVRRDEEVAALFARTAEEFGGVDHVFNNAGTEGMVAPIPEYGAAAAAEVLDTNVLGVFLVTRHAIPALLARGGGTIVNTASFIGPVVPLPINAIYAASKAAVVTFTAATAASFPDGAVRAYAVCPWVTDTPMLDRLTGGSAEMKQQFGGMNPSGRMATANDIADAVVELLVGAGVYPSGAALLVDRGGAVTALVSAGAAA
jgi:NAD(P)-dependent dehydrogenase (short-subunit alcohol dehydrogenase family)